MKNLNLFFKAIRTIGNAVSKHAPELLTAVGIASAGAAVIFAVKATPKAEKLIDTAEDEKDDILTPVEKVKTVWKVYIPTAAAFAGSVACLIGANAVNAKRNAAVTAAFALSETALAEYRNKVVETIGEKKEELVRAAVVQDKIDKNPVPVKENKSAGANEVAVIGNGTTLCWDAFAGRYFHSDKNKIEKAINELNRQLLEDDYVSLNDFYDLIGLPDTDVGNLLGWNVKTREYIDARFTSHLTTDGQPCLAVSFSVTPKYDYNMF